MRLMSLSNSVISNSNALSALPRESCAAVTGSCFSPKPSLLVVESRSSGRPGVP